VDDIPNREIVSLLQAKGKWDGADSDDIPQREKEGWTISTKKWLARRGNLRG